MKHFSLLNIALVCAMTLATLTGCNEEERVSDNALLISARVEGETRPEANYLHTLAFYKNGVLSASQNNLDASFEAEKEDNIQLWVGASSNNNVSMPLLENNGTGLITLTDLLDVPDVLVGKSAQQRVTASTQLAVSLERMVARLVLEVNAPDYVTAISATLKTCDKISYANKKGIPATGEAPTQTVTLKRATQDKVFKGSLITAPSANDATTMEITFAITTADGTKNYAQSVEGTLVANKESVVNASVSEETVSVKISPAIQYEAWGTTTKIEDSIDLPKGTQEVFLSGINASQWVYFSFTTGKAVGSSPAGSADDDAAWSKRTDWDIAFCGTRMRTNSGTSGIGKGGIQRLEGANYDDVTAQSGTEYVIDVIQ